MHKHKPCTKTGYTFAYITRPCKPLFKENLSLNYKDKQNVNEEMNIPIIDQINQR